jgi:hypothetical protein
MAKFSKKVMGKEIGDAKVYAKPHTMDGKELKAKKMTDPNTLAANKVKNTSPVMRVSAGDPGADDVKKSGIKVRGTGAATKGLMARGPMA